MKNSKSKVSLSKYIAQAGISSRRKSEDLIRAGKVKVNGVTIVEPAFLVGPTDMVFVGRKKVTCTSKVYLLLNKPKGYISTVSDEHGRQTVLDLLNNKIPARIYPIGRLDRQTEGLLLFTNDGMLAQRLAHPRYEIKKTYIATLSQPLKQQDMQKIKEGGITLKDGAVQVDSISCLTKYRCDKVKISLHSGRYRIIRRLFERLGYEVKELERIKYAFLSLRGVGKGKWRPLSEREVIRLKYMVKL